MAIREIRERERERKREGIGGMKGGGEKNMTNITEERCA